MNLTSPGEFSPAIAFRLASLQVTAEKYTISLQSPVAQCDIFSFIYYIGKTVCVHVCVSVCSLWSAIFLHGFLGFFYYFYAMMPIFLY
jgi:hypothetical protein